jgi:hypothetical protein
MDWQKLLNGKERIKLWKNIFANRWLKERKNKIYAASKLLLAAFFFKR